MFTSQSAKQADMCRFCWMCRHICPVAGATGSESWGPRARGLMVSMIERGTEYDAEIAEAMYHCTMCEACANDCATGWRPTDFIREARMRAVVDDIAPVRIMKEIDNILFKGNIYGLEADKELLDRIEELPKTAENLLYIGQTGRTVAAATAQAVIKILKKAGVSFTAISDEPPTGAFLGDLIGYTGEVQKLAKATADAVLAAGSKRVIVMNPYDAVIMREQYVQWELMDDLEIVTVTAFLHSLIQDGNLKIRKTGIQASAQEPVKLTRGLEEEAPLLELLDSLGIVYVQLFLHGKMSRCIGTPLMECYDPSVVHRMVEVRQDDARRIGSSAIIACSPDDFYLMSKYAAPDVKILDLFALINENS